MSDDKLDEEVDEHVDESESLYMLFLREMTPRTLWLILNAPLVHEPLHVYNRMHHEMQALNPLLLIETKLCAHIATNCPCVQLGKWVFATPTNELVAIIILGAPSCKLLFLWLQAWDNPM